MVLIPVGCKASLSIKPDKKMIKEKFNDKPKLKPKELDLQAVVNSIAKDTPIDEIDKTASQFTNPQSVRC